MNNDSKATQWRKELATRVGRTFAENGKVDAVVIAGSVGRGWADAWSDVELDVFWNAPPTDTDRQTVIESWNGVIEYYFPLEESEWSDAWHTGGTKIEVSSFLTETIAGFIGDVVERFDTATDKQLRLAALQNSVIVSGEGVVTEWRERIVNYPNELARRMIAEHIEFGGWNGIEMLFDRDDLVLAYDRLVNVEEQILAVLHGVNRMYLAHPRGKWLDRVSAAFVKKPPRLAERMRYALTALSLDGARELHQVIEETFALVEQEFPDLDIEHAKRDARYRRVKGEEPNETA